MKRILLFFFFLFGFFLTSYGSLQNIDNVQFKLYIPEKPYINSKFEFIEKGKILVEYDKIYYEALINTYSGKDILFWENTGEIKTEIKYDGDKVHIIFHKGGVIDKFLQYHLDNFDEYVKKEKNSNEMLDFCNNSKITKIIGNTTLTCSIGHNFENILNTSFDHFNKIDQENILISLINRDYKSLGEILNKNYNQYNPHILNEYYLNNLIKLDYYDWDNWTKKDDYLKIYNNYLNKENNKHIFHIEENKEDLYNYITDSIFYSLIQRNPSNGFSIKNGKLYLNKNNEVFYIGDKTYDSDNFNMWINSYKNNISCYSYENNCMIEETGEEISIDILKDNISIIDEKIYFNISKFITDIQKQGYFKGFNLEDIFSLENIWGSIGINGDNFHFPYIKKENNNELLPLASKIASPKDINTNPFMVGLNILLALLYLITFYFTAQFFNSYFERVATKNNINKKLSDVTTFILKTPFLKINNFFKKILEKNKYKKLLILDEKLSVFLQKNEHKIWIILGLLFLGIIGQITVDDFDVLSLKGLLTIIIMIFILGLITFFKDFILYFLNKSKEKENIKIENIPIGFLLATIVASSGRSVGLEPNMLFGNVLRIKPKDDKIEKKLLSGELVLKVLFITFIVGITFWFLTLLFSPESFFYKFFIIAYFGIINDVFFALLPFGLLWGVYIFNEKKLRIKWFIFTFIVFLFLIHTILNPEGDLQKVLDFDGNILILVGFLIFWILTALGTYLYFKKSKKV